jgi:hypothetical protein
MSSEDELALLRRLTRQLIELLESRGIDWLAELDPVISKQQIEAAKASCTSAPEIPIEDPISATTEANTATLTTEQKITLFRKLFRGRTDVYPVRWQNSAGRSGYSPACFNEWKPGLCDKPTIKCSQCPNQGKPPVCTVVA